MLAKHVDKILLQKHMSKLGSPFGGRKGGQCAKHRHLITWIMGLDIDPYFTMVLQCLWPWHNNNSIVTVTATVNGRGLKFNNLLSRKCVCTFACQLCYLTSFDISSFASFWCGSEKKDDGRRLRKNTCAAKIVGSLDKHFAAAAVMSNKKNAGL